MEVGYLCEAALATLPCYGWFKLSDSVLECRSEVRNIVMFVKNLLFRNTLILLYVTLCDSIKFDLFTFVMKGEEQEDEGAIGIEVIRARLVDEDEDEDEDGERIQVSIYSCFVLVVLNDLRYLLRYIG